jgi:uncharacterized protein (DUF2141 family)
MIRPLLLSLIFAGSICGLKAQTLGVNFSGKFKPAAMVYVEVLNEKGVVLRREKQKPEGRHINIADLEAGRYALRIFQDLNGNGKLDTGWMGIPSEPYGFSNNAMGRFGPPSLADQLFYFDGKTPVDIALR